MELVNVLLQYVARKLDADKLTRWSLLGVVDFLQEEIYISYGHNSTNNDGDEHLCGHVIPHCQPCCKVSEYEGTDDGQKAVKSSHRFFIGYFHCRENTKNVRNVISQQLDHERFLSVNIRSVAKLPSCPPFATGDIFFVSLAYSLSAPSFLILSTTDSESRF